MVSDSQTVQFWPHSVIHNRKAVHLTVRKLWWKVIFGPPLKRQNFRDASGLSCYPHLISCLIRHPWDRVQLGPLRRPGDPLGGPVEALGPGWRGPPQNFTLFLCLFLHSFQSFSSVLIQSNFHCPRSFPRSPENETSHLPANIAQRMFWEGAGRLVGGHKVGSGEKLGGDAATILSPATKSTPSVCRQISAVFSLQL